MRSQTVRIGKADHDVLVEVARKSGKPLAVVLSTAIRELQRRQLLQETNEAYSRLRSDAKAWREEAKERALWDNTLADGVE